MPTYSNVFERESSNDPFIPEPVSAQVIKEMPLSSAVLSMARVVPMSSKTTRQPVLSSLPLARFVATDTTRKETTEPAFENLELVAEEIATLVVVPDNYIDDSQVPIWDEVRPLIAQAFGKTIDAACLFGTNKPVTWGTDLATGIAASNNDIKEGDSGNTGDLAADIAKMAEEVAQDGFSVNGFASKPGLQWRLVGLRSPQGVPIYTQPNALADSPNAGLYGFPLREVLNGGWSDLDFTIIGGDWSKAIVGLRKDLTYSFHTDGVISDDSGVVQFNAMQQDSTIMRAVMRVAWAVADPVTAAGAESDANTFAFGAVVSQPT